MSLVVALWLARSIVVPVRRMTHMARAMAPSATWRAADCRDRPTGACGRRRRPERDRQANLAVLDRKAQALANEQFDAGVLDEPLPGRIGEALGRSLTLLSTASSEREGCVDGWRSTHVTTR